MERVIEDSRNDVTKRIGGGTENMPDKSKYPQPVNSPTKDLFRAY
jgi:hypothetical protein